MCILKSNSQKKEHAVPVRAIYSSYLVCSWADLNIDVINDIHIEVTGNVRIFIKENQLTNTTVKIN